MFDWTYLSLWNTYTQQQQKKSTTTPKKRRTKVNVQEFIFNRDRNKCFAPTMTMHTYFRLNRVNIFEVCATDKTYLQDIPFRLFFAFCILNLRKLLAFLSRQPKLILLFDSPFFCPIRLSIFLAMCNVNWRRQKSAQTCFKCDRHPLERRKDTELAPATHTYDSELCFGNIQKRTNYWRKYWIGRNKIHYGWQHCQMVETQNSRRI